MKIKWFTYGGIEQVFKYVDENTINIDGEDYTFQLDAVIYPDVAKQTNGLILEANKQNGELYLTVLRLSYNPLWNDGEYSTFAPPPPPLDPPISTDPPVTDGTDTTQGGTT
jgi:hypothetical protein